MIFWWSLLLLIHFLVKPGQCGNINLNNPNGIGSMNLKMSSSKIGEGGFIGADGEIVGGQSNTGSKDTNGIHHDIRHSRETTIRTTTGQLRGLSRNVLGKDVYVYYGIPFAEPPIGNLRFKKPVPIKNWNGRFDAVKLPNSCIQERYENFPNFAGEEMWNPNTDINEDCLYLNLWVPKSGLIRMRQHMKQYKNLDNFKGLPILVWFYGGGFMAGTSSLEVYNADVLSGENDVIVATPNYRIGAFGFLYLGTEDAPGNQGMWDQVVAMQWIKDNSLRFGGDPESITLFGESAGGGSVSFHMLSPVSRHLLTRGIMQSGTLNAPWSVMNASDALGFGISLLEDSGCLSNNGTQDLDESIECLREIPAKNISLIQWNSYKSILAFPSGPTIDGSFLPRHPNDMLRDGDFKKTELMLGSNQNEGTYFVLYDFLSYFNKDVPSCLSREKFLEIISLMFPNRTTLEKEAILFQYTHWDDVRDQCKNGDLINELAGDYFFICPTNYFAEAFSAHHLPVYYYYFTQRTSSNPWGEWMGVIHGEEVEYVFGHPLKHTQNHTFAEIELSRRVMRYFVRFAATGSPTADDESEEVWPLYTREDPEYFILNGDPDSSGTGRGPRTQACAFWNEFMPLITPGTTSLPSRCGRERWDLSSDGIDEPSFKILEILIFSISLNILNHILQPNVLF